MEYKYILLIDGNIGGRLEGVLLVVDFSLKYFVCLEFL